MPKFSEDNMQEYSEAITPKFSKMRFKSLHNVQTDEQIEQSVDHITAEKEHSGVLDLQAPSGQVERNGNGHHGAVELEELKVLDPQQPIEQIEHNGHNANDELLEDTEPRLP